MSVLALLIDTDVLIDLLTKRSPFAKNAGTILRICENNKARGFIAAHSITNIFYLMRKDYSVAKRKELLRNLLETLSVVEINASLINNILLNNDFDDIEDCLQAECARVINADYIVTRNIKDYSLSAVPAILPEDLLKLTKK
ncbi:PIN domain-containing protein [Spirochaetia bacterium]|nr:PIN domain-containing protein [Spirochaetia bacterium]